MRAAARIAEGNLSFQDRGATQIQHLMRQKPRLKEKHLRRRLQQNLNRFYQSKNLGGQLKHRFIKNKHRLLLLNIQDVSQWAFLQSQIRLICNSINLMLHNEEELMQQVMKLSKRISRMKKKKARIIILLLSNLVRVQFHTIMRQPR